jgi:Rps23 Pro-64 3,4-dihydroxylase Tpa1-like proline 4-hydroxylase
MDEPIYHITEDFYNPEELKLIFKELETVSLDFEHSDFLGAAKDSNNNFLKEAKGVFLDELYSKDRSKSDILLLNRKIFHKNLVDSLIEKNTIFRFLAVSNIDHTLINYYENADYYKSHFDKACMTAITFFFKEPKKFEGGDLILNDFNITIKIKNNMVVFFPSCYWHEVTKIKMDTKYLNQGLGRYSMSQFINVTK